MSQALHAILAQATAHEGGLAASLREHDDLAVLSVADAEALASALASIRITPDTVADQGAPVRTLASLVQAVDGDDRHILRVVQQRCIPELLRLIDDLVGIGGNADPDLLLFLLKVVSLAGTTAAADRVLAALARPVAPDAYLWSIILRIYSPEHPQRGYLLDGLGDQLPAGFAGIALLDTVNAGLLAGEERSHPFDCPQGHQRLRSILEDTDPRHASHAVSVTAAVPFISRPAQDHLLTLAMEHADPAVRLEACWAAAKLGRDAGVRALARLCLDVHQSAVAQQYLAELDRADAIPSEALAPEFQARAEFSQWLAHPNELGRAPDEIVVRDQRLLPWPPDPERRLMSVVDFRVADASGLAPDTCDSGVVGSMTFCLFGKHMARRPPEDVYALHCAWELRQEDHLEIDDDEPALAAARRRLAIEWRGPVPVDLQMAAAARCAPCLAYPQELVAVGRGVMAGAPAFVILDGPRSRWYPVDDFPAEESPATILDLHIGRVLLGFTQEPERRSLLAAPIAGPAPAVIVDRYERFGGDRTEAAGAILQEHFRTYCAALVALGRGDADQCLVQAHRWVVQWMTAASPSARNELVEGFGSFSSSFEEWCPAAIRLGAQADVEAFMALVRPSWDHNLGKGRQGLAAFLLQDFAEAERIFVEQRRALKHWYRYDFVPQLAEIWTKRGQTQAAQDLMIEGLHGLVKLVRASRYASDRTIHEGEFQHLRSALLRLFPDVGADLLATHRVPSTTRTQED